jgi:hypothetical protein
MKPPCRKIETAYATSRVKPVSKILVHEPKRQYSCNRVLQVSAVSRYQLSAGLIAPLIRQKLYATRTPAVRGSPM